MTFKGRRSYWRLREETGVEDASENQVLRVEKQYLISALPEQLHDAVDPREIFARSLPRSQSIRSALNNTRNVSLETTKFPTKK